MCASNLRWIFVALLLVVATEASSNPGYPAYTQPPPSYPNDPYGQGRDAVHNAPPPPPSNQYGYPGGQYPSQPVQPPHSQYPPGTLMPYRRGRHCPYLIGFHLARDSYDCVLGPPPPAPPPQQDGFFSKIKSSIAAAGSALAGLGEGSYPSAYPDSQAPRQQQRYPPAAYGPPQGRPVYGYPQTGQTQQPQEEGGLFGKLKNLFQGGEESAAPPQQPPRQQPPRYSYPPQQPPSQSYQPQTQGGYPPQGPPPPPPSSGSLGSPYGRSEYQQQPAPRDQQPIENDAYSGFQSSQQPQQQGSFYAPQSSYNFPASSQPPESIGTQQHQQPQLQQQQQQQQQLQLPAEQETESIEVPEVSVHGDAIVFVLHPRDLERKKALFTHAGPQALQVFADFEHVFTTFRLADGRPSLSSSELLENSGLLSPEAVQALQSLTDSLQDKDDRDEVSAAEEAAKRAQLIIARQGRLHYSGLAPATRTMLPLLGFRDGGKEVISTLTARSVPVYLFSSGYADVIAQALWQSGVLGPVPSPANEDPRQALTMLPPNLRLIANFMRAGPDGAVRAFSNPLVHMSNHNASTAEASLGMPLPSRPHAVILAAHEDDVSMADGVEGLREVLTVGLLEVSEDLPSRLPTYLTAFDVVLVGDCSLHYARELLEDILQLPRSNSRTDGQQPGGLGKLMGLRKLLTGNNDNVPASPPAGQSTQNQSPSSPPPAGAYGRGYGPQQAQGGQYGSYPSPPQHPSSPPKTFPDYGDY
eukprot:scaffold437_cov168-Ochromonas_danica.AAC.64